MECEQEMLCKNKEKNVCYRCFDMRLFKSKIKAPKAATFKKSSFQDRNKKDSWNNLEEETSIALNDLPTIESARRTLASGSLWFDKGDVKDGFLHCECKERKGKKLKTGTTSMSFQKLWLTKAQHEAEDNGKKMCVPFRFKGDDVIYVNMRFVDLVDIVNSIKVVMNDNETKDLVIKKLTARINKMEMKK